MPPKKKDDTSTGTHNCAEILLASRTHYLKHVSYDNYSWKYRQRIWEELRPIKMGKIDYGTSDAQFIISRKRISRTELTNLCITLNNRSN
jgi:O6-methylguanine-DNA--protein-cysteine methyltransferase